MDLEKEQVCKPWMSRRPAVHCGRGGTSCMGLKCLVFKVSLVSASGEAGPMLQSLAIGIPGTEVASLITLQRMLSALIQVLLILTDPAWTIPL